MRRTITSVIAGMALAAAIATPVMGAAPTYLLSGQCLDRTDPNGQILNYATSGSMSEDRAFLNMLRQDICAAGGNTYTITRL